MKMKAITVMEPGIISMDNVEIRPLKDNEILIKVVYAGICATDIAIYTGETAFVKNGLITYPCRIGHEWSGIVEATGENVVNFKKGDYVITDNGVSCGECDACKKGDYGACTNNRSVGTIDCWDGCFAEYMIMPEWHTYHIASALTLKEAALAEPLSISLASLKKYPINKETTIAVIGTGAIGLGCAAIASQMGVKKIIVVGRTQFKLEKALECGATDVINSVTEDLDIRIKELASNGVDFVIETSGGKETVMQAIDIVKNKGTVVLSAFYERALNDILIDTLVQKQVTLKGAMGEFGLVPEACRLLEKGLPVSEMITHCIDFDDVPEFFKHAEDTSRERIKVLVKVADI